MNNHGHVMCLCEAGESEASGIDRQLRNAGWIFAKSSDTTLMCCVRIAVAHTTVTVVMQNCQRETEGLWFCIFEVCYGIDGEQRIIQKARLGTFPIAVVHIQNQVATSSCASVRAQIRQLLYFCAFLQVTIVTGDMNASVYDTCRHVVVVSTHHRFPAVAGK